MEGIKGFVYRNAYEACFKEIVDKYFAPFIPAVSKRKIRQDFNTTHYFRIITNKALHTAVTNTMATIASGIPFAAMIPRMVP